MAYRDDIAALSARYEALTDEVAQKTRELDEARQLFEQARAQARLPVLDNLRIASPCPADWNAMTGDERVRHCAECKKTVYNVSGMTRDEAQALIVEHNGQLCVRYFQRRDGTIVLADCTIGTGRDRHHWFAAGAAAVFVAGLGAAAALHQLRPPEMLKADRPMVPRPPMPAPPPLHRPHVPHPPALHVPAMPPPQLPAPAPSNPHLQIDAQKKAQIEAETKLRKKLQAEQRQRIEGSWTTGVVVMPERRPPLTPQQTREAEADRREIEAALRKAEASHREATEREQALRERIETALQSR